MSIISMVEYTGKGTTTKIVKDNLLPLLGNDCAKEYNFYCFIVKLLYFHSHVKTNSFGHYFYERVIQKNQRTQRPKMLSERKKKPRCGLN